MSNNNALTTVSIEDLKNEWAKAAHDSVLGAIPKQLIDSYIADCQDRLLTGGDKAYAHDTMYLSEGDPRIPKEYNGREGKYIVRVRKEDYDIYSDEKTVPGMIYKAMAEQAKKLIVEQVNVQMSTDTVLINGQYGTSECVNKMVLEEVTKQAPAIFQSVIANAFTPVVRNIIRNMVRQY